jgi:hypothetical protein
LKNQKEKKTGKVRARDLGKPVDWSEWNGKSVKLSLERMERKECRTFKKWRGFS